MSIIARNISKSFANTKALDQVNFEAKSGHLVALLGPSGSGKTTLLRIIAGLESSDPGSGSLQFHGEEVGHLSARKRGVGMVFQHYALFRHMTVGQNISFGLRIRKRHVRPSEHAIREKVRDLLHLVQLDGLENRLPHQLSGGQRQRVALARALAIEPRILLLDEPFGALDAKVRKDLRRWLRQFQEEIKLTTVFVTHDQEEALELADEVVVMNNARIEQVGDPQEVFDYPASPFVIEFMGNVNRLQSGYRKALSIKEKDQLYVRPHDIEIRRESGLHDIEAKVLHIFSAGSVGRVTLERTATGEILEAEISREELRELDLHPGHSVGLRFRHIRLFAKTGEGRSELIEKPIHYASS